MHQINNQGHIQAPRSRSSWLISASTPLARGLCSEPFQRWYSAQTALDVLPSRGVFGTRMDKRLEKVEAVRGLGPFTELFSVFGSKFVYDILALLGRCREQNHLS
jgi:hypothetical protein